MTDAAKVAALREALRAVRDHPESEPQSTPTGDTAHDPPPDRVAPLAATPQPGGSPDREGLRGDFWLIEQGQPEGYVPPIYYALDQPRTAHYPAWTKDPYKARMFERRELAVAFMESMRDGDRPMPGRPVEHGFIDGPSPAPSGSREAGLDVAE